MDDDQLDQFEAWLSEEIARQTGQAIEDVLEHIKEVVRV